MQPPVPAIWVDGEPAQALPLPDRGLDFGDGLFETLLLNSGAPLFPDLHLERLALGLQRLGFPDCIGRCREALDAASGNLESWSWAALRLTVTRGSGPRGYAPPVDPQPRIVVTAAPLREDRREFPPSLSVVPAHIRWSAQPVLAGIKHLNRLEQVLAASEAAAAAVDDVLVRDAAGNACSLSAANLFIVESGRLVTPRLDDCGIAGTRRRLVLEQWAPRLGMGAAEEPVSLERLLAADEVFCTNSLRGLQSLGRCERREWTATEVCRSLHAAYLESIAC